MARAHAHFAAGRYPQAIGAYRAALGLDPSMLDARIGIAEALTARGQCRRAVDGLVEVAGSWAEEQRHDAAMSLYLKALALDPSRMELHLEMAFVEEAMGNREAAVVRVEGLADHYMSGGRTEEAAELLRFVSTWGDDEQSEPQEVSAHEDVEDEEEEWVYERPWAEDKVEVQAAVPAFVPAAVQAEPEEEEEEEEWVYERPWAEEAQVVAASVEPPTPASTRNPGLDLPPINTVFISGDTVLAPNPLLAQLLAEAEAKEAAPAIEDSEVLAAIDQIAEPEVIAEPEPELVAEPEVEALEVLDLEAEELAPYESGAAMLEDIGELIARDAETVARAPSRPLPVEDPEPVEAIEPIEFTEPEPDLDMVTRIARIPLPPEPVQPVQPVQSFRDEEEVFESSPTVVPIRVAPEPQPEPETVARAILERPAPAYRARPVVSQTPVPRQSSGTLRVARAPRPGAPKPSARPVSARPAAPSRPVPSRRSAPMRPTPAARRVSRPTAPNPLVDRLRARAGLGSLTAAPRTTRARATEAISTRSPIRMPSQRDEDVTVRFRRPRGLDAAI